MSCEFCHVNTFGNVMGQRLSLLEAQQVKLPCVKDKDVSGI